MIDGDLDWSRVLRQRLLSLLVYAIASAVVTLIARDVYFDRPGSRRRVSRRRPEDSDADRDDV